MSVLVHKLYQRAALAATTLCLPMALHAAPAVSLTAVELLGGTDPAGVTDVIGGYASGGDFYYANSTGDNASFFHTYGDTGSLASFGARTSGTGTWYTRTSATYTDSYTNSSGSAQTVVFSFYVDGGQIGLSGSGRGYADLALNLSFNGSTVASEHGRVEQTAAGVVSCSDSGTGVLASYMACGASDAASIYSAGTGYSVGYTLAAGETLSVVYEILATTSGEAMDVSGAELYCDGFLETFAVEVGQEPGQGGSCAWFNGLARSGDPAGFMPSAGFSLTAQNVPEPGSLLLAATAALGLLATRRRRA
ncbi:PEP-CTERM sorting domain-containing protein [Ideonella sp. DXS22W]|uniref:PEP-CTERM sorting domain-containing protein n=1 Tax=Pseudaquabacterium inlustre TaxID=2984192 RepID=A0ABU9CNC2_9BURK